MPIRLSKFTKVDLNAKKLCRFTSESSDYDILNAGVTGSLRVHIVAHVMGSLCSAPVMSAARTSRFVCFKIVFYVLS